MSILLQAFPILVQAKDHYIFDVYFNRNADFYDYPVYLQEGVVRSIVQNLKPWISGNVAEHSYTIVLTELSSQPSSESGLTRILPNLSFDDLTGNLLSVLQLPPTGPPCPDYFSRIGPLQYINSRLPADAYFEHTYFFYISNEAILESSIDPKSSYQGSLNMLKRNGGEAQRYFSSIEIDDNVSAPAVYEYDNPLDSLYDGTRFKIYLQKHVLTFSDDLLAKTAAPPALDRLIYDRRTLGGNRLTLFPSREKDSFCMLNILQRLPDMNLIPDHCVFFSGNGSNNTGFAVPANWCLQKTDGASGCGMVQPDTSMVLGKSGGQQFPLYQLLMPYLIISGEYGMDYTYNGSCAVSGNLITGVYDHLVYTDTLNFALSLVPPLNFKKAGFADVVLDNPTLLAKAADLFDGQPVTQDQVLERLQQGKAKSKLIIILIMVVAVLIILYYYYFRKNVKINPLLKVR